MILKNSTFMAAALSGLVMIASAAPAQNAEAIEAAFEMDDGASQRINLSGRLRMLSQMIPAAACQVANGYDSEYFGQVLLGAANEFDQITNALEFGDEDLGIPTAEERRLTLAAIVRVRDAWAPLHAVVDDTIAGTITDEELSLAFADSKGLLDAAKALVIEEVAEYSNPAQMAQADSFLIDIAGRQRMLIQMIAKNSCFEMHYGSDLGTEGDLATSMSTFETTLGALRSGMESVGIRKPPTPQIDAGLTQVATDYAEIRPYLQDVVDGTALGMDEATAKFKSMNELMATMNGVVIQYVETVAN